MRPAWVVLSAVITATALGFLAEPTLAATDDQNLTGLAYLADGTPLSATMWADNTSFAVYVNHGGSWATAWRYPVSPAWYLTSGGAYGIVLPAAEKDVSWGNGDPYRVVFDVSAISGVPGRVENATSHGTGDPGEFPPYGSPDNAIAWNATDNWQRWDVVLLALPDLAVLPGGVTAIPGTVQSGQVVSLSATVRNLGNAAADALVALFDDADGDRFPDPGEAFDTAPVSLPIGQSTTLGGSWIAAGVGVHALCAYADPGDLVREADEGNNADCATTVVQPPPETRPDYAPVFPQPPTPVRVGLGQSVAFSLEVRNDGNATASATATVAFFNDTSPGSPFATFPVPPLAPSGTSVRFAATWTSPATPGSHDVVADVDYADDLAEWDETNNRYTWTVEVVAGPVTALVVGAPSVTAAESYVTSGTLLSFTVLDQSGAGIRNTTVRVDGGPWVNYTAMGPFTLPGEGPHFLEWFSEDFAGNVEAVANATLFVDDTPPATSLAVGGPRYVAAETFVTSSTPLSLSAADGGAVPVGLDATEYRIDGGGWATYGAPFPMAAEGGHTVEYRSRDLLGNEEPPHAAQLVVDDSPPTVAITVGTPRHEGADMYVTSVTALAVTATDGGAIPVGVASVECRVSGVWTPCTTPITLSGPDGPLAVEARASDLLGNTAGHTVEVVLDDTPPVTTPSDGDGTYPVGTTFAFPAADAGSGLARTDLRVDDGDWTTYAAPLELPEGAHAIRFRSVDHLNNTEAERTLSVTIAGVPPTVPETNWKPLVAAVFCAVLVVVGFWSARQVRANAASQPRLRAFVLVTLPFVALEAATGVVSLLTGWFAIPPIVGLGTAVDVGTLVAGAAVLWYRLRARTSPK